METRPPSSGPSEVFARNLRELVAREPSISAVSRDLEINRTQLNRYLSGEAHPRPEVLARICAHFRRDARILLIPLAEIDALADAVPPELDLSPFWATRHGFDHVRMPDGLYHATAPYISDPDLVLSSLIQLTTTPAGNKLVHWAVPREAARPTGKPIGWRDRKQVGPCLQHADGVSMLMASQYTRLFLMYFVSPGYQGLSHVHAGYAAISMTRTAYQSPLQPLLIERVHDGLAGALSIARQGHLLSWDQLTPMQRGYFKAWAPGWPRN